MNLKEKIICTFFLVDGLYFGDNCIQIFHLGRYIFRYTVGNLVLRQHVKRPLSLVFMTSYHLMQVKSIAECSKGSLLQYLRPWLSYYFVIKVIVLSIFEWPFLHRFYCMFVFHQDSVFNMRKTAIHVKRPTVSLKKKGCYVLLQYSELSLNADLQS